MHKRFDHKEFERKWQEKWQKEGIYDVGERDKSKEKEYVLVEWPYPSGNLHIGHWYAFALPDIYARFKRMKGKQVLYPMGFDAFGLPAENAAIKNDLNPREWTEGNIKHMRVQLASMGASFSWDKTTSSIDPDYYKWTQYMFTKFFENDIAYRGEGVVNWCPDCNTVVANEQVLPDDTCERSGDKIEKKKMPQWMLRITDFADELIDDLDGLDWPSNIKESQKNWIGRSKGAEIDFELSVGEKVTVFTTRPDTLFGATYMVLAPEHELVLRYRDSVANWDEVESYINISKQKAEQDRLDATKEKTGVKLEGITATNPASGEAIPVFIADYVLASYGTGAIMAVPAHDERDNQFAQKFNLPIKQVVRQVYGEPLPNPVPRVAAGAIIFDPKTDKYLVQYSKEFQKHSFIFGGLEDGESYEEAAVRETLEETGYHAKFVRYLTEEKESHFYHPGKKVNRSLVSRRVLLELTKDNQEEVSAEELEKAEPVWLTAEELRKKLLNPEEIDGVKQIFEPSIYSGVGNLHNSGEFNGMSSDEAKIAITEKVGGRMTNTYRLRDWSVGRQRYWGTPIPIVYDPEGKAHAVPQEHLPWILPEDVDFKPTGVPPLAKSEGLKKRTIEIFGEGWTPEVETMDTFVDSSWYFLRYLDSQNGDELASIKSQQDWMPVDLYFGGAEHTTMHLLYSRFWQKALRRLGMVEHSEPYKMRINRGLILGPDGNKMSKSKGNVIDPDEQVALVGSDSVKLYLAFMGPYQGANYPWDMNGIAGVHRFLEKVNGLSDHIVEQDSPEITRLLHKTILKVSTDITEYKFNTAISAMMIFVKEAEKLGLSQTSFESFLKVLAPFAPHLTEEIWHSTAHKSSIHLESYPKVDMDLAKDEQVTIGLQINGKLRGEITISPASTEEEAWKEVIENPELKNRLEGVDIIKKIYVPGRIYNIIVKD